jgi:hypothetical protein
MPVPFALKKAGEAFYVVSRGKALAQPSDTGKLASSPQFFTVGAGAAAAAGGRDCTSARTLTAPAAGAHGSGRKRLHAAPGREHSSSAAARVHGAAPMISLPLVGGGDFRCKAWPNDWLHACML